MKVMLENARLSSVGVKADFVNDRDNLAFDRNAVATDTLRFEFGSFSSVVASSDFNAVQREFVNGRDNLGSGRVDLELRCFTFASADSIRELKGVRLGIARFHLAFGRLGSPAESFDLELGRLHPESDRLRSALAPIRIPGSRIRTEPPGLARRAPGSVRRPLASAPRAPASTSRTPGSARRAPASAWQTPASVSQTPGPAS
jgi:hypothetical protein